MDMANSQMSEVVQHLRRTVLLCEGAGLTDGQLLEGFVSRRDESALAALVRRHGPMVWGVCRRLLRNHHDAEDAFQAAFLVLVRKASSVVPREMVANWLYGVAYQTALKARAASAKRRTRERQVTDMPEPEVVEQRRSDEMQDLLDGELSHLPDKYRAVLVLCDLEGMTRKEAARQLAVPEGTVAGRLARARAMLAKRLARHGLHVSGCALAEVLSTSAASACVPAAVVSSTIRAATLIAAGKAAAAGLISHRVAALTEGVLKTMFLKKLKLISLVLFLIAIAGVSVGGLTYPTQAADPVQPEGAKEPDTSPKWEYRALTRGEIENLALRDPKAKRKPGDTATKRLGEGLNKLGGEGWELVTVEPGVQTGTTGFGTMGMSHTGFSTPSTYLFKRHK
jgi:RNA polymerase sigma factor (sigma-70 family)